MKLSLVAAAAQLSGTAIAATPDDWRSQSIYFLLTDRFGRTDNSTTAACDPSDQVYCGGSWQGIINNLDYIQGMGFTAIWISPITEQLPQDTSDGEAYHGYWQQDIYSINSNFGTAEDLKSLSAALHDRGMYLMVDVVPNHMGYAGSGTDVDYSVFNPFNSESYFHPYCEITDYNNLTMVQDCWEGDDIVCLPDLNTTETVVQNIWYSWIADLVANYSVDGLRIDSVEEVQPQFFPDFNNASGVYCIGEVDNGDPTFTCPYQNYLDGILDYPMYYPLLAAFESSSGSISDLYNMIDEVKSDCVDSNLLGTFVENHDNPRFASYTDDYSLAKNAIAFTILSDGIPIIYAGEEQHYDGSAVPNNREATWLSGYNTSAELYQWIATLNQIRNYTIHNDDGFTSSQESHFLCLLCILSCIPVMLTLTQNYPIYQDDNNIALRKGTNGSQLITLLTNVGSSGDSFTLNISGTGFSSGDVLTELISCTNITVGDDGDVSVTIVQGGIPSILYLATELTGSGHPC